eukprot:scaffold22405_cov36-Prasinocladus_malaysianus.AAC.1
MTGLIDNIVGWERLALTGWVDFYDGRIAVQPLQLLQQLPPSLLPKGSLARCIDDLASFYGSVYTDGQNHEMAEQSPDHCSRGHDDQRPSVHQVLR